MSDTIFEAEVVVVKNKFEPKSIRRIEVDTKEEAQAYIADLKEKLGNAVVGTRITRHVTESYVEVETGLLDRSDKIVIDSPVLEPKPEPTLLNHVADEMEKLGAIVAKVSELSHETDQRLKDLGLEEPAKITDLPEEPVKLDLVSELKDQIVVEAVKAMDNNYAET